MRVIGVDAGATRTLACLAVEPRDITNEFDATLHDRFSAMNPLGGERVLSDPPQSRG